jgi:hypothetical protein
MPEIRCRGQLSHERFILILGLAQVYVSISLLIVLSRSDWHLPAMPVSIISFMI